MTREEVLDRLGEIASKIAGAQIALEDANLQVFDSLISEAEAMLKRTRHETFTVEFRHGDIS